MLISTPHVNSHQLMNNLPSSNSLHSSLPPTFPSHTTLNPTTWTTKDVEEWLRKNDLNECIDLICIQHRMNGQRLMNLKEHDVLQLKGTSKNQELWEYIRKLQHIYSSNYHLWTARQNSTQTAPLAQNIPMTAASYFAPNLSQGSVPHRPLFNSSTIRSGTNTLPIPSAPKAGSAQPITPTSSYSTLIVNQNQYNQSSSCSSSTNSLQAATPTTVLLERSPLNTTRSMNNQQYQRRSLSHSLSTSNTSINILPTASIPRASNSLLNNHRTPPDQLEDQLMTDCCCIGSIRTDRKKTLFAFLLAVCTVYFCSFIITIVDERLPDPKKFDPLPDLILENIKQIPWAFSVTEKIILIEIITLITIVVLHRHR